MPTRWRIIFTDNIVLLTLHPSQLKPTQRVDTSIHFLRHSVPILLCSARLFGMDIC